MNMYSQPYTEVSKSRLTVVHMEKDMQVVIITMPLTILRTQNCKPTFAYPCMNLRKENPRLRYQACACVCPGRNDQVQLI